MFNSKFGVGILKHPGYNVGGGIGEAALIGAAFGGAKAIATGQDPLESALLGGLTGGAMSGITGAILGPSNQILQGAETGAPTAINTVGIGADGVNPAFTYGTATQTPAGISDLVNPQVLPATETLQQDAIANAVQNPTLTNSGVNINNLGGISQSQGIGVPSGEEVAPVDTSQSIMGDPMQNAINNAAGTSTTPSTTLLGDKPGFDIRKYTTPGTLPNRAADWWANQGLGGQAMYSGLAGLTYGALNPEIPEQPVIVPEKSNLAGYDPNKFTRYVAPLPSPYPSAHYAEGGIAALASGGQMDNTPANVDFMGGDMYPQSQQQRSFYATPTQMPTSAQQAMASYEPNTNPLTGQPTVGMAKGGIARYSLGGYAAGGNPRLLKGPGDGMSDNIPATIGGKQPARLADGEFVVPADVVSHLGNGSTDAGAKHLYNMMDKVRKARTGSKKQGKEINPAKFMPA